LKTLSKYMTLFKRGKERFSHRVVVAVFGTTHARHHTLSRKDPSNPMVGILLPTVRVENQAGLFVLKIPLIHNTCIAARHRIISVLDAR
jgi:hypothetical protein